LTAGASRARAPRYTLCGTSVAVGYTLFLWQPVTKCALQAVRWERVFGREMDFKSVARERKDYSTVTVPAGVA
jgi:hypothetical protein